MAQMDAEASQPATALRNWVVDRSKPLGSGTYGNVYACACLSNFCKRGAIKIIPKQKLMPSAKRLLDREVEILKQVGGHPNIVQLYEAFETEDERYIVMERITGQDLFEVVRLNGPIRESAARILFEPIFAAVADLHAAGIIHRDLKLENVMIPSWALAGQFFKPGADPSSPTDPRSSRQADEYRRFLRKIAADSVKLIDFGMAGHVDLANPNAKLTEWCGSLSSASVELVGRIPYRFEVDIWALGVLLYTVVAGYKPFDAESQDLLCQKIMREPIVFPEWFSNELCDMIAGMMHRRAAARFTIREVQSHVWAQIPEDSVPTTSTKLSNSLGRNDYSTAGRRSPMHLA